MTAHKAWVGAVVAALTTFIATVQASGDVNDLGLVDWLIVGASAVVAGLSVYAVPNQPKDG
jgi:hypothetical protein